MEDDEKELIENIDKLLHYSQYYFYDDNYNKNVKNVKKLKKHVKNSEKEKYILGGCELH